MANQVTDLLTKILAKLTAVEQSVANLEKKVDDNMAKSIAHNDARAATNQASVNDLKVDVEVIKEMLSSQPAGKKGAAARTAKAATAEVAANPQDDQLAEEEKTDATAGAAAAPTNGKKYTTNPQYLNEKCNDAKYKADFYAEVKKVHASFDTDLANFLKSSEYTDKKGDSAKHNAEVKFVYGLFSTDKSEAAKKLVEKIKTERTA